MKTLFFILAFTFAVMGFIAWKWIRHSIKQAKSVRPTYCMNATTKEVHKIGCERILKIPPADRAYLDEYEVRLLSFAHSCRRCGGLYTNLTDEL